MKIKENGSSEVSDFVKAKGLDGQRVAVWIQSQGKVPSCAKVHGHMVMCHRRLHRRSVPFVQLAVSE